MLATGGSPKVEIFDVQQSTEPQTCTLPDFPIDLEDAVAKIFDNTPWICGGTEKDSKKLGSDKCFSLDIANNRPSWKSRLDSSMKQSRSQPAAALIQNKANNATVSMYDMSSCRFKFCPNSFRLLYFSTSIVQRLEISRVQSL